MPGDSLSEVLAIAHKYLASDIPGVLQELLRHKM